MNTVLWWKLMSIYFLFSLYLIMLAELMCRRILCRTLVNLVTKSSSCMKGLEFHDQLQKADSAVRS
jgi:hypothetical protein